MNSHLTRTSHHHQPLKHPSLSTSSVSDYLSSRDFYGRLKHPSLSTSSVSDYLSSRDFYAYHSNNTNMLSRVTARVLLDSAKNRAFFGSALFSGTPNQQPHKEEIAAETRKMFLQFSRECYKGYYLDELIHNVTALAPCHDHIAQDPDDDHIIGANCCLSLVNFRLMRDVAFEIATLHQNKVIHGNINPHNIFVFRGKRLFAKLLDDDTSKWKAPEQLLNGSQTKASDMFNFGCVLFTCITKGGHPFGNTLDQCYDNIMENRKSLSRVKCYPEAFNLLSRMLNREPKLRPIAMEVLSHPLFWNSEKRLSFLKCCSKQIEYEIKQSNLELLEALESIAPIVMDEKWDEEIRTVRNACGFKEVQSLLRFISETFSHYYSIPARISGYQEELQPLGDSLKPHYRILDEYFTGRYPWLLIYLYNLMLKHFRGMSWLSVYCLREYNQMHDFGNVYWDLGEQDEDDEYSDEEDKDEDEDEYSDEEDEDEDEVEDLGLGEENEDEDED